MRLLHMLRDRDPGLTALRRSCRAGIVAPGLLAVGVEVIGNTTIGIFAAFGSISLLLFAGFTGPLRVRLALQATLIATGTVLVCLGALASPSPWSATVMVALVAFGVLFSGVVSSVVASSATSLLASFILSVSLPGGPGSIPDRLAGYLMAGAASLIAVAVLWPAPAHDPLRLSAARSSALLSRRLRAEVDCVRGDFAADRRAAVDRTAAEATEAVTALRTAFFAAPYRPTGLSTGARALVRLVDEVVWLEEILQRMPLGERSAPSAAVVCETKLAAADLLEAAADRLELGSGAPDALRPSVERLRDSVSAMERVVTAAPPTEPVATAEGPDDTAHMVPVKAFVGSLEPSFRAQEMAFVICAMVANIDTVVAARNRRWWEVLLGDRPAGIPSPLSSVQQRAGAHVQPHSVWLHNSVRGTVALTLAVLIAELTGVQHAFWVVFGTMAVLRSNALQTGQNALRSLLGTMIGIVVGGALIYGLGSNTTVFWALLPIAIVFTGLAPAAISFAAGQAGFTAVLLILFNIIDPSGWTIGLVRIEDVAIGCAVSVGVGILFWPRGAGAALSQAAAEALAESARYLRRAIEHGVSRCDARVPTSPAPDDEQRAAAAAARRLDDAFRGFLAERGTKHLPLSDVTAMLTAVAVLRLTADAVRELWLDDDAAADDRTTVRSEILATGTAVCNWYQLTARALAGEGEVPDRMPEDRAAEQRLLTAIRLDIAGCGRRSRATEVKLIWTADHVDVARRLQDSLVGPARAAAALRRVATPASDHR